MAFVHMGKSRNSRIHSNHFSYPNELRYLMNESLKKRSFVCQEIVDTEEHYVRDLE